MLEETEGIELQHPQGVAEELQERQAQAAMPLETQQVQVLQITQQQETEEPV